MNLKIAQMFRFAPLFGLFFLVSCAGNGTPLTENTPQSAPEEATQGSYADDYFDDGTPTAASTLNSQAKSAPAAKKSARSGAIGSAGFNFKVKNPADWALISGPEAGESGVPYEFYNASTGRRAVLIEVELPQGEPMRLMDRAQVEMQAFESSGKKATLAETYPEEAFGTTGAFFDVAGKRYETPYEAVGFVTGGGNHIYTLTLSATDDVPAPGALKEEWKEFFADFQMLETAQETGPELSPENVQSYHSDALGYDWAVKDTLWHHWMGISRQNEDPDLVLSNKAEDVSLFVYGAMIPQD